MRQYAKTTAAAVLMSAAMTTAAPAWAGINDYEFKLLQPEVKKASNAEIAVQVIDRRTGQKVPGAVIFAQRLDMAPDNMEAMTSTVQPLPSSEPGLYRFKIDLTAPGGWRLSLAAKLQGETGTLEGKLPFKAVP